ncbi:MAG TPA: phosphate ABC transporter substrate-binding protein PstS [Candidatus Acidoferrales bacterium]|jgi:phosphate transport system substrate-binding protein|nr:phosphate ABC transporter substrate-binding protein PstS [Candidatus Acidoferrales bacterium]
MFTRRSWMLAVAALSSAALIAGCNYSGEDSTKEKDFAVSAFVKTAIGAAGSTFVNPIMTKWIASYQQAHPGTLVNYRPIGSGAGIEALKQSTLEIAASDMPLSDEQLKGTFPLIQVPITAGAVCAVYNLPDLKSSLRFSSATLAGIFLGNIISWQDPAIAKDNPGVTLPHAAIIVVHRSEGSGTTSIFTSYLAKVNPDWSNQVGSGLSVKWPVGIAAQGTSGVLDFVKQNIGTIGYAELNYASAQHLPVAAIQNRGGSFVAPSAASTTAAVQAFDQELAQDARASIVDPPASAKEAYPISGISFFLIAKDGSDAVERQAIRDFTQYIVTGGQDLSEGLDYARLPKPVQDHALGLLGQMQSNGQPIKSS